MTDTKTESMVGRVARAIGERAVALEPRWELDWPYLLDRDSNAAADLRDIARAAIEAMREPTEEMLKAADAESYAIAGEGDAHSDVWHWMIDAALSERP